MQCMEKITAPLKQLRLESQKGGRDLESGPKVRTKRWLDVVLESLEMLRE